MNKAYSVLTLKAAREDTREVLGLATTPSADHVGDIVEPKGAKFSLPIPLLWQHNAGQPVGWVHEAEVTSSGIRVRAQLARVEEPGRLRDRLDEAWGAIKAGLVRGLSIGFASIAAEPLSGGGTRFRAWRWLELSCVTVPANADCSIVAVKSAFRAAELQATRRPARPIVRLDDRRRGCVYLGSSASRSPGEQRAAPRRRGVVYL